MSKKAKIIPLNSIEKIAVLFGNGQSMAQVKGDADFIMNGGYYDMTTGKPVCHLKANGTVYAKPGWNDWGYTWDSNDIRLAVVPDDCGKNYITATKLLAGSLGPTDKLTYNDDVAGARQRTAMALTEDSLILYCSDTPTTPETLRDELVSMGAVSALMLDGGGSSQCDFQGDCIYSSRRVNNYIAVWLKKSKKSETESQKGGEKVKVVLDPGHGVETAGKRSPDGTYLEHEFALDMAKRIKYILSGYGLEVHLTREDEHDIPNSARADLSNEWAPDLFVSLHSNAAGDGSKWMEPRGFGIYTSAKGDTAGRNIAAKAILKRAEEAGLQLWGGGLHHERWTVLVKTNAPAVLIEHLFHDNKEDVELLKSDAYRDKLAEVDAKGILDYLGIPWQDKPAEEDNVICCPHCGGRLKIEKG